MFNFTQETNEHLRIVLLLELLILAALDWDESLWLTTSCLREQCEKHLRFGRGLKTPGIRCLIWAWLLSLHLTIHEEIQIPCWHLYYSSEPPAYLFLTPMCVIRKYSVAYVHYLCMTGLNHVSTDDIKFACLHDLKKINKS